MYDEEEYTNYFPSDVERLIIDQLDDEDRYLTRGVNTRWNSYKSWCTQEFIRQMRDRPLTEDEVKRSTIQRNVPFFILIKTGLSGTWEALRGIDNEVTKTLYIYDPDASTVTVFETIDKYGPFIVPDSGKIMLSSIVEVSGIRGAIEMMVKHTRRELPEAPTADTEFYLRYWMDPYTVRDVMIKRLGDCSRIKIPLKYYLPRNEEIGDIFGIDSPAKLYVVGIGIMSKLTTIDEIRRITSIWDTHDIYEKIEDSGILDEII